MSSPSPASCLSQDSDPTSPLPQIVAGRRANGWKADRKRRLRARAAEIAERCSTLARALRKQMPPCRCVNPCGHRCLYLRSPHGHGHCLTCLGKHRDLCPVCLEPLTEGPVVTTDCDHRLHAHCLRARVEVGAQHNNEGDPLLFDFLECPFCRSRLGEAALAPAPSAVVRRQQEIARMVDKLQVELGPGRFIFQVCRRCTLPYCSGEMACHSMARGKVEAICNPCSRDQPAGKPKICSVHGADYIAWKCRYCCSVATFECFSGRQQLHVCDTCHDNRVLDFLFDFNLMANALPLEQYGVCPVRRSVYGNCGNPLDPSQLKAIERRLAIVSEKAARCEKELEELLQWGGQVDLQGQNNAGALHRLRRKAHSLRVEREDLGRLVDGWPACGALVCPFNCMHPPTGVEYCLGCTLCEQIQNDKSQPTSDGE